MRTAVQSNQRRCARRVDTRARALQTKHKGYTPSSHRHIVTRHRVHRPSCFGWLRKRPVGTLDAEEDGDVAAHQHGAPLGCMVQRRVPVLEEQPLLRVHRSRLSRRGAKGEGIKALRA